MVEPFFPELPDAPKVDAMFVEPPRDPGREPRRDELGAAIVIDELIAATDRVAILLESARVHSDGVLFVIARYLRRAGSTADEWAHAQHDFSGYWGRGPSEQRIRWGLALGDGERVLSDLPMFGRADHGDAAIGHTLVQRGGGGPGGMEFQVHVDELWLHPLPPAGALEVVVQWPAFGIPESRVVLDGAMIAAQAACTRPMWPD